jgi:hypothetical protein
VAEVTVPVYANTIFAGKLSFRNYKQGSSSEVLGGQANSKIIAE